MTHVLPEAIVFDFDGIIVDSEPVHFEAYQIVLKPRGLGFTWDDYRKFYMGFDDRDAIRKYFQRIKRDLPDELLNDIAGKKAAVFPTLAAKARPFPGVVELIRAASREVKTALCSGAVRTDIQPVIERLDIAKYFQAIVTADDVEASKPNPESYQRILERLGAKNPAACVAIEDTPAGIAAATGAGMKVLAVTNSHPHASLGAATARVETLVGLTPVDVRRLVN